jgi:hypothetical protein
LFQKPLERVYPNVVVDLTVSKTNHGGLVVITTGEGKCGSEKYLESPKRKKKCVKCISAGREG